MIFIFPFQNLYLHNNFCQKIVFNNTENKSNFRWFFAFLPPPPAPPNNPEIQNFEQMKKKHGDIIILHIP